MSDSPGTPGGVPGEQAVSPLLLALCWSLVALIWGGAIGFVLTEPNALNWVTLAVSSALALWNWGRFFKGRRRASSSGGGGGRG